MRVGILMGDTLSRWQLEALERIADQHELYGLRCGEWRGGRSAKHALYYALNLVTVRNRMTTRVALGTMQSELVDTYSFSPAFDGAWAILPDELLRWIAERKLDAIVKFGLGLVRVPDAKALAVPILSYHHGDPRQYRGRPAGFYEVLHAEPFVGQIVQALGARIDSGAVYAFAQSPVVRHSYRKTLIDAYRLSPYLLDQALENVCAGQPLDMQPGGRNYRLPDNALVVRFVIGRIWALLKHWIYGAFFEKRWRVAIAACTEQGDPVSSIKAAEGGKWRTIDVDPAYSFYADPFFGADADEILVEGLNRWTGKGEIVRIADGKQQPLSGFGGHVSYPASVKHQGRYFIVPETSEWCRAAAFDVREGRAAKTRELDIESGPLLDPTLFSHNGRLYLFANRTQDGPAVLHLWHAADLFSRFELHPASPIRASARGSRMAGEIASWGGQLYRLGQDLNGSYGNGILAFKIDELTPTTYSEIDAGSHCFRDVSGPHTVNRRGSTLVFDYYSEGFSPLAGIRRLMQKL